MSLAVHAVILTVLGIWSLKVPEVHVPAPPLTVFLEAGTAPAPVVRVEEKKQPPAAPKAPERKKSIRHSAPSRTAAVSAPPPEHKAVQSSRKGTVQIQGPQKDMEVRADSTEPLTVPQPKPLPKPAGSKVVYGDAPPSEGSTTSRETPPELSKSVVSTAELTALASSLKNVQQSSPGKAAADTPAVDGRAESAVSVPDSVSSLTLDTAGGRRKPVTKLVLNIPEEMLKEIGHDSFLTAAFTLTPDGYIMNPKVVVSQVSPRMETMVLEALRKWEFNKGSSSEGNVNGQITIRFKVK